MNVSAYVLLNVDIEELLSHKLLFSIQSTPKLTFYCFFDFSVRCYENCFKTGRNCLWLKNCYDFFNFSFF